MSYCKEEGKDRMIFASEDDLSEPSKALITDIPANEEEISNQGFVLANGELNWECSCKGSMVAGKCGVEFREFFTCVFKNKDDPNEFEKCMPYFDKVDECIEKHSDFYQTDSKKNDNVFEDEGSKSSKVTLNSDMNNQTEMS